MADPAKKNLFSIMTFVGVGFIILGGQIKASAMQLKPITNASPRQDLCNALKDSKITGRYEAKTLFDEHSGKSYSNADASRSTAVSIYWKSDCILAIDSLADQRTHQTDAKLLLIDMTGGQLTHGASEDILNANKDTGDFASLSLKSLRYALSMPQVMFSDRGAMYIPLRTRITVPFDSKENPIAEAGVTGVMELQILRDHDTNRVDGFSMNLHDVRVTSVNGPKPVATGFMAGMNFVLGKMDNLIRRASRTPYFEKVK
jgi:hypothetical protein